MSLEKIFDLINKDIIKHVDEHVFPVYNNNDLSHGLKHILDVINRAFELKINLKMNLDSNMIYVIAAYHDIGRHINDEDHEIVSAKIFLKDTKIKKFFSDEKNKLIVEAIEDHRASLKREPRSIYGKLISSADRNSKIEQPFIRTHQYSLTHTPNLNLEQKIKRAYDVLKNKFDKDAGYANTVYYDDGTYAKYITDLQSILSDYDLFRKEYLKANKIDEYEYYTKMVDINLRNHIEHHVFPQYNDNDEAHGILHIKEVIRRSFELLIYNNLNLDPNIVFAIASYHDLGKYLDHENHEKIAAQLFINNEDMKEFFSDEQRQLIKDAIEDHRSSFNDIPRSNYGKLISSADRNIRIEVVFLRSYQVGKWKNPDLETEQYLDFTLNRLRKRYGDKNLENMFYEDDTYKNFLHDIRILLENEKEFKRRYCQVNNIVRTIIKNL